MTLRPSTRVVLTTWGPQIWGCGAGDLLHHIYTVRGENVDGDTKGGVV